MATYSPGVDWGKKQNPRNIVQKSLNTASKQLQRIGGKTYSLPEYYGGNLVGPATADYYQTQSVAPITRIDAPQYQMMQGGDYDAWEQSLRESATTPINRQFSDTQDRMNTYLGGGGLYGSSIQADTTADLGERWAQALGQAGNMARSQRMGLQQQDLQAQNAWILNRAIADRAQEQNIWQAAMAEQARMDDYNQGRMNWQVGMDQLQRDFENQQVMGQYQHDLMRSEWERALDAMMFDRSMQLATGATPARAIMEQESARKAASGGGFLEGLGNLAGGYLAAAGAGGSFNPLDWIKRTPPTETTPDGSSSFASWVSTI